MVTGIVAVMSLLLADVFGNVRSRAERRQGERKIVRTGMGFRRSLLRQALQRRRARKHLRRFAIGNAVYLRGVGHGLVIERVLGDDGSPFFRLQLEEHELPMLTFAGDTDLVDWFPEPGRLERLLIGASGYRVNGR